MTSLSVLYKTLGDVAEMLLVTRHTKTYYDKTLGDVAEWKISAADTYVFIRWGLLPHLIKHSVTSLNVKSAPRTNLVLLDGGWPPI